MSALDTTLRLKIQDYIMRVHERFHLTTILVSHDILEVVRLAKKVFVIDHGKLIQQGVPGEILPLQALKQMIDKLPDQKVV
jgi:molybdate transport system ATP-binding protein